MSFPKIAMVLAAGRGVRLRPLTDDRPKALVEVGGRPVIEYPLRMLAAAGVEMVVVNLHHLGHMIRDVLGDGARLGLRVCYSEEPEILETGGALVRARPLLGDATDFGLVNCDVLADVDLGELGALHARTGALATLVVRPDPAAARYGPLDVDAAGRVRRFLERPDEMDVPLERRMFCGIHVVSARIFARMPRAGAFSITRDVYAEAHAAGEPLYALSYDGYWRDVGTPEGLAAASSDVTSGRFAPTYLANRSEPLR